MDHQLLFAETVLKAVVGGLLIVFPKTLLRVLGLAASSDALMQRLLGAVLLGMAAATFLETRIAAHNGLGLTGHAAINLTVALTIIALLLVGRASPASHGRIVLGLAAGGLLVLALFEIAWA